MTLDAVALAAVAVVGLAVGSFLNVVADRLPRGESVLTPRSHCPRCGRRLAAWELAPLVSFVYLRGRCHTCGAAIGWRTPLVEAGGAIIALGAWWVFGPTLQAGVAAAFGWLLLALSVIDIEHHLVPRALVFGGMVVALVVSPWWLAGGVRSALEGAAVMGLPYALLYIVAGWFYGRGKGVGQGDAWMAVLVGLVTGYPAAVLAVLGAALSALAVVGALLIVGLRGRRDAVATVPFLATGAVIGVLWHGGVLGAVLRIVGL